MGDTTLETQVVDSVLDEPLSGVAVQACRLADPGCQSPLNPLPTSSDSQGLVKVSIPAGGNAIDTLGVTTFIRFSSASTYPALYFPGYPVTEPVAPISNPYVFLTPTSHTPVGWDPNLGLLDAVAYDCLGTTGPGVAVTIDVDAGAVPFCIESAQTLKTGVNVTAATGASYGCGYMNVPPGLVTVTATPLALGRPSSRMTVVVEAGTITTVFLYPMPAVGP
jgi:hypothetical protein